ncbi:radical SAM family heme chaperone HemW [Ferrimonas balearica]|uniref:radical SAM family heme chaperone HemW n=1 Tax=Ferrimonas balearica TaxID=44012 RepID=UPI001C99B657|nr:radical SAM family heme chaperone HemW [Ferrimonas balearica]MBY5921800.1 radical SAM family heme chaperone HemW [Ferrimonas balearica]MBY5994860.1 radical SAM family heme chaperone HemW [Ferrimonas balearica]
MSLPPLSLYIHIPWCEQKCPYCDFNSHARKGAIPEQEYIAALLADLDRDLPLAQGRELVSIFIGGGTPSLISPAGIATLLQGVAQRLPLAPSCEVTMEANPGTLEADRFRPYREAGVNRLSVGVQSFQQDKLLILGRIHGADEARRAAQEARKAGFERFNLDLMHTLPGQSVHDALYDLEQAIALAPPHLSWYQLTIEPNTQFASKPPQLPDDDTQWAIFEQGKAMLEAAGYRQYEISAWAQPGYQCEHNLNYWRFGDYLGIGCGAHGKITRADGSLLRTVKVKHPKGYLEPGRDPMAEQFEVAKEDQALEYYMNRLRLMEAMPLSELSERTQLTQDDVAAPLDWASQRHLIRCDDKQMQLTEQGHRFLNELLAQFLPD